MVCRLFRAGDTAQLNFWPRTHRFEPTQCRSRFSSAKSDAYKVHALVRILFAQPLILYEFQTLQASTIRAVCQRFPKFVHFSRSFFARAISNFVIADCASAGSLQK
jgi:hypothetical protein